MDIIFNTAKKMMLEGKPALGAGAVLNSLLACETLVQAGFDFILVDDQHGLWDPSTMVASFHSIYHGGSTPMARVRRNDFGLIGAMLDRGALGLVIPMVNTAAEAEAAAYAARYPPLGGRSLGSYGCTIFGADYTDRINDEMFLAVQIESEQAAENVEEIMSVDGVDGCWIGPADLARTMGVPMGSPAHVAAIYKTLETCKKVGKIPGIAFGDMPQYIKDGFLFLTPGDDRSPIYSAGRETIRRLRGEP